jgi:hypothetical protein
MLGTFLSFGLFCHTLLPLMIQPGMSFERAHSLLMTDPANSVPSGGLVGGVITVNYRGSGVTVWYVNGKVDSVTRR